jgi:tRNA (cytidine/uridine-2'-O-)-methyltransferase
MFDVVLYEPEIPPNTGNILRLAVNTGSRLHLVRPLGFTLRDKQLARAGLDYADFSAAIIHEDWPACRAHFEGRRMFAATTRGAQRYDMLRYIAGDVFVFGPETRGLPENVLQLFASGHRIRVPMRSGSRSLNLSNSVAIVLYEAWRQNDFTDGR